MNKVIYGAYTFQDADLNLIQGGKASLYWSPLGDELRAAYFSIPVQFYPRVWHTPAQDFKDGLEYGAPVDIYEDNTLLLRFYLTDITGGQRKPDGSYVFELVGTDFVGLFTSVQHLGGIYNSASAGNVIMQILGASKIAEDADETTYEVSGITFKVDADIVTARIDNWLPATQDARENLRTVLQLLNAAVSQDPDGTPRIGVVNHGTEIPVSEYEIYQGDTYVNEDPVTVVQVNEYAYFQIAGTAEETIYDASAEGTNGDLIIFDKPYYDVHGDVHLTVNEWGANFARVTGSGILSGKPYTVASRTLAASTGLTGADNVKTIDNTLCSSIYSSNLLTRMTQYFSSIEIVRNAIAMPEHYVPGRLLRYPDPMNEEQRGFPIEMALTFSGITKADGLVTAGWAPQEETPFTQTELITSSGTYTPPAGATRLQFWLIQGGTGGWGGYKGEDATLIYERISGAGGPVGEGGDGGKVLRVTVEYADLEASYNVTIGTPGTAGGINHGQGNEGGETTIEINGVVRSSAEGIRYPYGLFNFLDGVRYADKGQNGIYSGNAGYGLQNNPYQRSINDAQTSQTGTTTTWMDGNTIMYGVGGGGAAYGEKGENAHGSDLYGYIAGNGGDAVLDGFNGYTAPVPTIPGTGGLGGNGGGGGGAGGYGSTDPGSSVYYGNPGDGGNGSIGGDAAPGAIVVLAAFGIPPTPVNDGLLLDANGEPLFDLDYERLKEELS